MRLLFLLSTAVLAAVTGGCTSTRQVAAPLDLAPRQVVEVARYEVRHQGALLGSAVQLEIEDRDGPLRFWRVENRNGAWLGHATEQGRFSRRLPFRDDEQDLGVWPMAQGIAQLFEVDGQVALQPVANAVPASARRQP